MKSKLVMFFTIVVTFLLQCTLCQAIAIGSIKPNLLLILCVSMGLMRGQKSGLFVGFFAGLLQDIFYGSLFGFYALIYMYVGYLSGCACKVCYDDDMKVPVLLSAGADLLYNFAVYALQFLLRGRLGLFTYVRRIMIPEMLYTVLITVLVYRIYYGINNRYMHPSSKKESESVWVLK